MKPKLYWTQEAESYIQIKHNVRRDTLDALMDADDLSMVASRFGRLLLQGKVGGKCYRLIVEVVDREKWILEPVTAYRYGAGDRSGEGNS